jgi:hypothetical protein
MIRRGSIVTTGFVALFATACDRAEPTAPAATQVALSMNKAGASCAVDVGGTQNPLPALHELEGWLGDAIDAAGSNIDCGETRSLDAKMEALAKALDQSPPNFAAACGISGAIVAEVSSLVAGGRLSLPTFSPPFPGGPTNVLAAAEGLNERWCAAKTGDLVGPPDR